VIAVGVGASRGCPKSELEDLVGAALGEAGLSRDDVDVFASVDVKADEPAVFALGTLRLFSARALARVPVPTPSAVVAAHVGTPSVAEAAALLAAGEGARLLVDKRRSAHATCAIARS
jgi:cobalt-precorrin 5A hydrolase